MKQLKVNNKCSGCGLCIVNSQYLKEDANGNAQVILGKAIKESDIESIEKVIKECPESALEIIEKSSTNKSSKVEIVDVIESLKKKCDKFSVTRITGSEVPFIVEDYYIPVPDSSKEYVDFTSESSAKSAAREEFKRLCYSESAYLPMIKKVFVEYKVKVLKPYYTCYNTEESAYYKYNQYIHNILAEAYMEIMCILGDEIKIPESWMDFNFYLSEKEWAIEALKKFDDRSTSSGIITHFKERGEYTKLNWYLDRLDFNSYEEYVGEGLFGNSKYKNKWYFTGFYTEASEFVDDLKNSIDYMSGDIQDGAAKTINYALQRFEEEVKKKFKLKIQELEGYIKYLR